MPDPSLSLFETLLTQLGQTWNSHHTAVTSLQAEWDAQMKAEHKAKFPGKRVPGEMAKVKKALGRDGTEDPVYLSFCAQADVLLSQKEAKDKDLEERMRQLAPTLEIPRTTELELRDKVDASRYGSQGYGANKYAQAHAQRLVDDALRAGLRAEVRVLDTRTLGDPHPTPYSTFGVFVDAGELGWEIVKRLPPLPLRDWLKACWKRGVNPRVMNPFLPHGLEERLGVSFFGDDVTLTPASASAA